MSFRIACRQLGFAYGEMSYNYDNENNTDGSDVPVGMEYFSCTTTDPYLSDCNVEYSYGYYYYCTHNQDVFLSCFKSEQI